jgi:Tol biopolymer transport system component
MRRRISLVVSAVVFSLVAGVAVAAPTGESRTGTRQLIAFNGCSKGSTDLYAVHPDGTGLRNLTKTRRANEWDPSWSPDGAWLVFDAHRNGAHYLYLLKPGGRRMRRLIRVPGGGLASPAWAPDGRSIAFSDHSDSRRFSAGGIYLVGRNGKNLRKIAGTSNHDLEPSWSPSGKTIAYWHGKGGIRLVRIDGKRRRQLTSSEGDYSPAWSPDGRRIAFSRRDSQYNDNIWVMNSDGSGQRQLTGAGAKHGPGPGGGLVPGHATEPTWSPTQRKLAFVVFPSAAQLYEMAADGRHPHPVRRGLSFCGGLNPSWQP